MDREGIIGGSVSCEEHDKRMKRYKNKKKNGGRLHQRSRPLPTLAISSWRPTCQTRANFAPGPTPQTKNSSLAKQLPLHSVPKHLAQLPPERKKTSSDIEPFPGG